MKHLPKDPLRADNIKSKWKGDGSSGLAKVQIILVKLTVTTVKTVLQESKLLVVPYTVARIDILPVVDDNYIIINYIVSYNKKYNF